jgi:hypothetical protein
VFALKVTLRGVRNPESVERLWPARLRWRMRGAWLWPAFFGFTFLDGILLTLLPPYEGTPPGALGGWLLAGFANLLLIAVPAPLLALALRRRRRPDLPQLIATDYVGAALCAGLAAVILVAGLLHRPAIAAEHDRQAATRAIVGAYVRAHAREWAPGLPALDLLGLQHDLYRACVPGTNPARALCLFVATDEEPPKLQRDDSMEPNDAFRTVGGFR